MTRPDVDGVARCLERKIGPPLRGDDIRAGREAVEAEHQTPARLEHGGLQPEVTLSLHVGKEGLQRFVDDLTCGLAWLDVTPRVATCPSSEVIEVEMCDDVYHLISYGLETDLIEEGNSHLFRLDPQVWMSEQQPFKDRLHSTGVEVVER